MVLEREMKLGGPIEQLQTATRYASTSLMLFVLTWTVHPLEMSYRSRLATAAANIYVTT